MLLNFLYRKLTPKTQKAIEKDAIHKNITQKFDVKYLKKVLEDNISYRNVFFYRVGQDENIKISFIMKKLSNLLKRVYPPAQAIEIYVREGIGDNFWINHNYCVINAQSIGEKVWIDHGVTIGKDRKGNVPVLGNNVMIYPNATIVGGVKIGDNVVIGAGSFVNFDVPENSVVKSIQSIYERGGNGCDNK